MAEQNLYELITETLNERFKGKYFKWGFSEGKVVDFSFTKESFLDITVVQEDTELGGEYSQTFTFTQKDEGKWWLVECLKKWKIYDTKEEMQKANLKNEN